ncbi:FxSxx-COOH cyclophane-containing RiPP peptide [Kitasatospora azatica]|uniref:FxSxx-COOH cyclophane-containing RiPP peptide n=1 Tax=Kitasatospora azatica TaxID=58347 RepID=UPI0005620947|nr:FxSxx-COOH cyclophane-containing RiPP peptide [Kitasatospora azatica]
MTTALVLESAEYVGPQAEPRTSLDQLATLGVAELTAQLHRALPAEELGQVPVAAFNSSI